MLCERYFWKCLTFFLEQGGAYINNYPSKKLKDLSEAQERNADEINQFAY